MSEQTPIDELIRSRRTINQFQSERPPEEIILQALDVACWAPNHKLTEPWRFYLLGAETAHRIVELNAELTRAVKGDAAADKKRAKWSSIPGWLVVNYLRSDDELRDRENYAAVCCAIQNLSLSLWEKSIGIKWTTGDVIRTEDIYQVLSIDHATEEIVGLLWYGYPAESPSAGRKPLTEVMKRLP